MKLIEKYRHKDEGYNPFLITEKWQVAQLNYSSELGVNSINKIDKHFKTDEVFILLKGTAVLITAEIHDEIVTFETCLMQEGITYNIPKLMWHSIALGKDAEVIIVEDNNTHIDDFEFFYLNKNQQRELKILINKTINL